MCVRERDRERETERYRERERQSERQTDRAGDRDREEAPARDEGLEFDTTTRHTKKRDTKRLT